MQNAGSTWFPRACKQTCKQTESNVVVQIDKKAFEADSKARATANSSSRYGQQEVCQISGLIINSEETRVRDHKMGRNYRCAGLYQVICGLCACMAQVHRWVRNVTRARLTLHAKL